MPRGRKRKEVKTAEQIEEAYSLYFQTKLNDSVYDYQQEIISAILMGRDVLAILATGSGKSLCFQLPALLLPGITIVVTPLKALMEDQAKRFNERLLKRGITDKRAEYINSDLSFHQMQDALFGKEADKIKLIYVSPERLETPLFRKYVKKHRISMVVADEAHCVSMWGYDFRPSYGRIPVFIEHLETRPIVAAFTATATRLIADNIILLLGLRQPFVKMGNLERNNLNFRIYHPRTDSRKMEYLKGYLKRHKGRMGIVYCNTRTNVDKVYDKLSADGFCVGKYYADGPEDDYEKQRENEKQRKYTFEAFRSNSLDCVIATNAFGMGIDSGNVSFVIHYNMPLCIENYYQEAGRAGRVSKSEADQAGKCDCILYYAEMDVQINRYLIEKSSEEKFGENGEKAVSDFLFDLKMDRLQQMEYYCKLPKNADYQSEILKYLESYKPSFFTEDTPPQFTERIDKSIFFPRMFMANSTMVAGNLRKGAANGRVEIKAPRNTFTVEYHLAGNDKISYFDMMVQDAVFTLEYSGMPEFSVADVIEVLTGDRKRDLENRIRTDIEESIERLRNTELELQRKKSCMLPLEIRKKGRGIVYSWEEIAPLGYYAERMQHSQFLSFPLVLLNTREKDGSKIVPDKKDYLMIKHYLLYRIELVTENQKRSSKNRVKSSINNVIRYDKMFEQLGITFGEDAVYAMEKKKKYIERIKRMLTYWREKGVISYFEEYFDDYTMEEAGVKVGYSRYWQ